MRTFGKKKARSASLFFLTERTHKKNIFRRALFFFSFFLAVFVLFFSYFCLIFLLIWSYFFAVFVSFFCCSYILFFLFLSYFLLFFSLFLLFLCPFFCCCSYKRMRNIDIILENQTNKQVTLIVIYNQCVA